MNRTFWRVVLLAGLLSAVTAVFLGWDGRYAVMNDAVLANTDFKAGFTSWHGTPHDVALSHGEPRQIRIQANPGGEVPLVTQIVHDLDGVEYLRVTVDLRTEGIVPGWQFWQRAGVFFYSVSRDNRRIWYWPFEVALIDGTSGWRHHEAVIPVDPDAGYMQLFLFNASRGGHMFARNLTVEALAEHPLARWLWWGLIGVWVVFAVAVLVILLRRRLTWLSAATCGGAVLIVVALLWPQPELAMMQQTALRTALVAAHTAVSALRPGPSGKEEPAAVATAEDGKSGDEAAPGDKDETAGARSRAGGDEDSAAAGDEGSRGGSIQILDLQAPTTAHLIVFVVLAVFARLAFRRYDPATILIALMAFALCSEIIQGFTITRTVELEDGIYNALGAILGLLAMSMMLAAAASIRRR